MTSNPAPADTHTGWRGLSRWLVGGFLIVTISVIAQWTQPVDDAWNSAMESAETPWLVSVAEFFHHVGALPIALPMVVAIMIGFLVSKTWWAAGAWVGIVASSQVLSMVIKATIGRSRPLSALVHESSAAYPSGHAMVSGAAMAIGLAIILGLLWPNRYRLFMSVGIIYAVVMAWSRTYLRAHWLTDVIGGLLLGTAVVLAVAAAVSPRHSDSAEHQQT